MGLTRKIPRWELVAWSPNLGERLDLTRKIPRWELVLLLVVSWCARVILRVWPLLSVARRSVLGGLPRWWHHVPGGSNVPRWEPCTPLWCVE